MSIIQFSINSKQKKLTLNFDNNLQLNFDFEYLRVFSPAAVKPKKSNAAPDVFHKKKQQVHPTDIFHYNHEVRVCNSVSPCVR